MITVEQARDAIVAGVSRAVDTETVPLGLAHGRFLADEVRAFVASPLFDNSAMDGYAVRVADLQGNHVKLPITSESRCGDAPPTLASQSAMRIFTGAPMPAGADAVVIQEDVERQGSQAIFRSDVRAGENIRRQGEDFGAGEVLYRRGRRLSAYDIVLMGTAGIAEVTVFRRARALVIATGDELVSPGAERATGQIYESNRLAAILQLQDLGVVASDGGIIGDELDALRKTLDAASDYDFIITSGGASAGDHDLVKQAFAEIGEINFWKVRIKPGKPVAFGHIGRQTHFFALPGNPVSSLVTFKFFVEPAVFAWNHAQARCIELKATTLEDFRRSPGRTEFLRGHVRTENGTLLARVLKGQGSHMVGALRETNALIRLEAEQAGFNRGEQVTVILLTLQL